MLWIMCSTCVKLFWYSWNLMSNEYEVMVHSTHTLNNRTFLQLHCKGLFPMDHSKFYESWTLKICMSEKYNFWLFQLSLFQTCPTLYNFGCKDKNYWPCPLCPHMFLTDILGTGRYKYGNFWHSLSSGFKKMNYKC